MYLSLKLFRLFIMEEFRAQSSMFRSSFLMYPLFILVMSGLMGLMLLPMRMSLSTYELVTLAHVGVLMSGMLVGGMALFMDQILERRMVGVRMLLQSPGTLPASYREFFTYFYFKDILYYIVMNVLPVILGLYLSTFVTGLHIDLFAAIITFVLAFVLGVSVSMALSVLAVRSRPAFVAVLLAGLGLIYLSTIGQASALHGIGRLIPPVGAYMGGSLPDVSIGLAVFLVLSAVSIYFIREMPHPVEKRYRSNFPAAERRFAAFGRYAALAAKEWTDLLRSGGLGSVLFSFVLPLLFLWGLLWMMSSVMTFMSDGEELSMPFNTIFYSIIIGFFASLVYGWLNNIDNNGSYRMLPVSMPDVIKAKLILFVVLNTAVSVVYLGLISLTRGELPLLPVGLYVMFMVSGYVGVLTAYLTGVFTNSLMFDYKVLTVFSIAVAPVLIVLIVLSFYPEMLLAVAGFATVMGVIGYVLLGMINRKWGRAEFIRG
jgi:hypothetical protein